MSDCTTFIPFMSSLTNIIITIFSVWNVRPYTRRSGGGARVSLFVRTFVEHSEMDTSFLLWSFVVALS